jgi:DNA-directed RNA polymerase specialized sigma24 family protein
MESENTHSVTQWIQAAKRGDERAGQALFERFFAKLVDVSRRRVERGKRVEDEEDAAVQAMFSFLSGVKGDKFPDVVDRASLWPLLMDMVVKNSKKQLRKQYAAKRGGGTQRGESVFINAEGNDGGISDHVFDSLEPEDLVMLNDSLQQLRSRLSEVDRQILELKLECRSNREIAALLQRPPRTIDRKVETVIMPLLKAVLEAV